MHDVRYVGQHQLDVSAQDGGDGDQLEGARETQQPAVHGRGVRGPRGPWCWRQAEVYRGGRLGAAE